MISTGSSGVMSSQDQPQSKAHRVPLYAVPAVAAAYRYEHEPIAAAHDQRKQLSLSTRKFSSQWIFRNNAITLHLPLLLVKHELYQLFAPVCIDIAFLASPSP